MNRIPGPYLLDRSAGTIHNEDQDAIAYRPLCFEDPEGPARDVRDETLRFLCAAANFCQHLPIEFMEQVARDDRALEMALHLSAALGAEELLSPRAQVLQFSASHRRHIADGATPDAAK